MSIADKWDLLTRLRAMLEGLVGSWVKEAREHLDHMEENILNDQVFQAALREWEEKLFPQCPAQLWQAFRHGKLDYPQPTA